MGIRILKAGMMTTVQDLGRTGYQSQGFSVAGVMDVRSFKIANLLLDNPENEAVLEFALIGPTLEFTAGTLIAITGGDFQPTINGEPAPMYTAIDINKGDVLKFGSARTGSRGYIAFSSYLKIPVVMGSRCTNMKSSIGGFKGRKLQDGDYIGFRIKRRYLPFFLSRTLELDEFNQDNVTLRVVMGPQDDRFSKQGIETFLSNEYTVTSDFDRMGCRLEGPYIARKEPASCPKLTKGKFRYDFGWNCFWFCSGTISWKAHYFAGRSPDYRWVSKDRDGGIGGYSLAGSV